MRTATSFPAMTSKCQFSAKRGRRSSSRKQHAPKLAKSSRNSAARLLHMVSAATVGAGMVIRLLVSSGGGRIGQLDCLGRFDGDPAAQPRDEQLDDLPIASGQFRRLWRWRGTGLPLDLRAELFAVANAFFSAVDGEIVARASRSKSGVVAAVPL